MRLDIGDIVRIPGRCIEPQPGVVLAWKGQEIEVLWLGSRVRLSSNGSTGMWVPFSVINEPQNDLILYDKSSSYDIST